MRAARRVRSGDEPPLRRAGGKRRRDKRTDREDDHDRLRRQVEQPIEALRQRLRAGDHDIQEDTGATTGSARSRITPAAEDARRQYGGSPASCQRRNLRTPRQLANERSKRHQQSFKRDARDLLAILNVPPPIRDQIAELGSPLAGHIPATSPKFHRRRRRGSVGTRCGCKVLPADVLDRVEEMVDAQIGRVDRCLACGKKPEVVI